ncbi:MAG: efflux RND transporter periplasmic adaptor subunit [Ignavibacteriales bacterium]|nr:efflux RND transporter periplasmic adaptor subunit [Ignavibacteriales bacterium]
MMETKNVDLSALRINRAEETGPPSSRLNLRTIAITVGVLVVMALVGMIGWNRLFSPAVEVRLATVSLTSPSQSNAILTASGYVVAQRKAAVASKTTGRMVYLGVVEGDRVVKDQVLARLEDSDIRAQLDQARANLRLNQADLKDAEQSLSRQKELLGRGLTSQAEYDAAEARYNRVLASIEVAKAAIVSAEVALEYTLVRAPFDGTVLTKNADVGEIVSPLGASSTSRAAVVTIADMTSLEVEADVSESNIERIKPNQPCEITLDAYPEQRYEGFVTKIVPTADRAKATVLVKVGFNSYDSRVLPEMSAKVLFLTKPSDVATQNVRPFLTVPSAAVVDRDGRKVVFLVRENLATEIVVSTGRQVGSLVEITSGLNAGDKVIDKVTHEINPGVF